MEQANQRVLSPVPVDHGAASPPATMRFAAAAKLLGAVARRHGLVVPGFRTPPRLVGIDRTLRRHATGGAIAVRVRGRPWPAVIADMIDGVIAVNRLDSVGAARVRADLWQVLLADDDGATAPRRRDETTDQVPGPTAPRSRRVA